jgi:hypothetical protein
MAFRLENLKVGSLKGLASKTLPLTPDLRLRTSDCYFTIPNIGEWCVSSTLPLPRYM